MRRALLLALFLVAACGGDASFRIDNVSLTPDDVPINPGGTEMLRVSADVFDDLHDVTNAWVQSETGSIWIDLTRGTGSRWSATMPLTIVDGFPAGTYRFDFHAEDDGGRRIVLPDVVRLKIRLQ